MRLLLHTCCGPCLIYPQKVLRAEGMAVTAYFHNPNIHPYREFAARLGTCREYLEVLALPHLLDREYGLTSFLRQVVFRERERCASCYAMRLEKTAALAAREGFDGFSTTLLYSRYQNHQLIKSTGERLAEMFGLAFVYRDFREGWQEGINRSKEMGMYRQAYCGCIYSEQERYDKRLHKHHKKD
jgi:epoxyqueuosine reductase